MKKVFSTTLLFTILVVSIINAQQTTEITGQETAISGTLEIVLVEKQEVYIRNDSRMIKFIADRDLCEKFKNEINSTVIIHYVKGKDGALYITTMEFVK